MSEAAASPAKTAALVDERGAIALVIANTIGTGVFTTSGFALGDLGAPGPVMLAWAAGGLYALCGVAVYADLAAKIPVSGGEYAFLREMLIRRSASSRDGFPSSPASRRRSPPRRSARSSIS
jgi:amino acid transporter